MTAGRRRATAGFGLQPGQIVGSYTIVDELGGGGMGMVYVAEHSLLKRRAAVKVLRPDLTHVPAIVQRFFNEARATTTIRHPGIVEIYDFGYTGEGLAYIVMELLEGASLGERLLQARRLPVGPALVIARRIALALAAAHERNIVHRDLKPDNVFLVRDADGGSVEQVKLLDFGIAKLAEDGAMAVDRTSTGVVLGTPLYMSPEQCRGAGQCDHRSDLYSLGCVLYELLAGRPPFLGEGPGEVLAAHMITPAPDVRERDLMIPAAVAALVARLLAKSPADRYPSATATATELERLIDVYGPPRRSAIQPTVIAPASQPGVAGVAPGLLGSGALPALVASSVVPAPAGAPRRRRFAVAALTAAGIALATAGLALLRATGRFATPARAADTRAVTMPVAPVVTPSVMPIEAKLNAPREAPSSNVAGTRLVSPGVVTSPPESTVDAGAATGSDARGSTAVTQERRPRPGRINSRPAPSLPAEALPGPFGKIPEDDQRPPEGDFQPVDN